MKIAFAYVVAGAVGSMSVLGCSSSSNTPARDAGTFDAPRDAGPADASDAALADASEAMPGDARDGRTADATMACDDASCAADEVCGIYHSGTDGGRTDYRCEKVPPSCGSPPTCQCMCNGDAGLCSRLTERTFTCNGV